MFLNDVIKEDIKVAKKYLNEKKITNIIIISNRVMSRLLIADNNEKFLIIVGWILKEIGEELVTIKGFGEDSKYNNALKLAEDILDKLYDMLTKKEYGVRELWELYFYYENKIKTYALPKPEDTVYSIKPELTRKINLMLIDHFLINKELLFREKNNLIRGIINDLSLAINLHGGKEMDFIVYIIFKALDRYYDYVLYGELNLEGKVEDKSALSSKLETYIEKLINIKILIEKNNIDDIYTQATEMISNLSLEYRKYVINYSDIYISTIRKKVELSKEAKDRIGNAIAKAFEE